MSWKTVALGDVCSIVNGGTPKSEVSDYWDGDLNWITPKEMGKLVSREISSTERKITEKGIKNSSAKLLPINSVILSSRAPIGHLVINKSLMATNQGCKGLVPSESLNFEYLYYFLSYSKQLLNDMGSGATFKELSGSKLATVEIPLPSLATQQKIVAKLDAIFAEIDKATVAVEVNAKNAEALFQSYLREIFTNDDLDWKTAELNSICDIFADGDWIESKDQSENGIRLIQTGNVGFGKFKARDSKARYISEETFKRLRCTEIKQNDILISRLPDPVGRACIIPKLDVKSITAVDCTIIRVKKEIVITEFFNFFCQSPQYFEQIRKNITGATRQRISRSLLGKTQIPIPPLVKQKDIVSKLLAISNELEKSSKSYTEKVNELTKLKQSILSQAFSGGLVKE